MIWVPANPTTYSWDSGQTHGRITLQKLEGAQYSSPRYVLQALETVGTPTKVRLVIDGRKNNNLNDLLRELFHAIGAAIRRQGLDFLDSLLPKEKEPPKK